MVDFGAVEGFWSKLGQEWAGQYNAGRSFEGRVFVLNLGPPDPYGRSSRAFLPFYFSILYYLSV